MIGLLVALGLYCAACWGVTAGLVFSNPVSNSAEDAWDDFWVTLLAPVILPIALLSRSEL